MYDSLEKYARELGADMTCIIDPGIIRVENWPRMKCQFGCFRFNRCYTCPPVVPPVRVIREFVAEYSAAMLFEFSGCSTTDDFRTLQDTAYELERSAFLGGYYKSFSAVAGSCKLCAECMMAKDEPCISTKARPSLEALGIDVYHLARHAGIGLDVVKGRENGFKSFGLVFIE